MKSLATKSTDQKSDTASKTRKNAAPSIRLVSHAPGERSLGRQATCACGGGCPRCAQSRGAHATTIQGAAMLAQPITTRSASAVLRRKCACEGSGNECDSCKYDSMLRRKNAEPFSGAVPSIVHEVLSSPGRSLDFSTRTFMESQLGHDFSRVRVHDDARAGVSARAVAASAYTVGSHVVFARDQYQPDTVPGRRLLAHELTHVMQDPAATSAPGNVRLGDPHSAEERQADVIADRIGANIESSGRAANHSSGEAGGVLRREPAAAAASACPDDMVTAVILQAPFAATLIVKARDKLDKFLADARAADAPEKKKSKTDPVADALWRHFSATGPTATTVADTLRDRLWKMNLKLTALDKESAVRSEVTCHSADENICKIADAYIDRSTATPHINLCPSFVTQRNGTKRSAESQQEILIHESSHAVDIQITDRAYTSQRLYTYLSPEAALANADSYSTFVMELAVGGGAGAYLFPRDQIDCPEAQTRALKDAMAYAEHWNWAALSGFADPNSNALYGEILWHWNLASRDGNGFAANVTLLQPIINAYQKAQAFFDTKQTLTCSTSKEDCQARFGLTFKDNKLIVCTSGPTAEPPHGCAACILGVLYRSYSLADQMATKAVSIANQIGELFDQPRRSPKIVSSLTGAQGTRRTVKKGDRGSPIPELQEKLIELLGTRFKVTGKFDEETEKAVTAFQASLKLTEQGAVKGQADEKTWAALHEKMPGEHGLPQGETFFAKEKKWRDGDDATMYNWYQRLSPADIDYSGGWVKEIATQVDPGEDTCRYSFRMGQLTGGAWRIREDNTYGPDAVGVTTDVVDGARQRRMVPCGYKTPQIMTLIRDSTKLDNVDENNREAVIKASDDAEASEYVRNELLYRILKEEVHVGKRNKYGLTRDGKKY